MRGFSILAHNYKEIIEEAKKIIDAQKDTIPILGISFFSKDCDIELLATAFKQEFEFPIIGASVGGSLFSDKGITSSGILLGLIFREHSEISFSIKVIEKLVDNKQLLQRVIRSFKSDIASSGELFYINLLILQNAFSLDGDSTMELIMDAGVSLSLAGGLAGDSWEFKETYLIYDGKIITDGTILTALYCNKPFGIGVGYGYEPLPKQIEINSYSENIIYEINNKPATIGYKNALQELGISVGENLVKVFAEYEIGIYSEMDKKYIVRAPIKIDNGHIILAGRIKKVKSKDFRIMMGNKEMLLQATKESVSSAIMRAAKKPNFGIFFSCAAREKALGKDYIQEVKIIKQELNSDFIGFTTYGEFARYLDEFGGFYNTTLVSLVI